MKNLKTIVIIILMIFFTFITFTREYHVTTGPELFDALIEAGSNDEDNIIYMAAGVYYFEAYGDRPPCAGFAYGAAPHKNLTVQGETGTSANSVIIDGHDFNECLRIWCSPTYEDLLFEERPEIIISGITFRHGNGYTFAGGLDIRAYDYIVRVTNCIISNNISSDNGNGGGLYISAHDVYLENSVITHNLLFDVLTSSHGPISRGGGVYVYSKGINLIRNNIIAYNTAIMRETGEVAEGGGLYIEQTFYGTTNIINNTIYWNEAHQGAGVYLGTMISCRINFYNNIIYGNFARSADGSGDIYCYVHPAVIEPYRKTVYAYNNDFSNVLGTFMESVNNMDVDPGLENPFMGDYHLAEDSLVIDQGLNDVPLPPGLAENDFEGDSRINGASVDIGADEYYYRRRLSRPFPVFRFIRDLCVINIFKEIEEVPEIVLFAEQNEFEEDIELWIILEDPKTKLFLSKNNQWVNECSVYYQGPVYNIKKLEIPKPDYNGNGNYTYIVIVDKKVDGHISPTEIIAEDLLDIYIEDNDNQ